MNPRPRHFYTSSERIARVAACIEPYFSLQIHAAALNSTVKATETVRQAFYHILRSIKTRFTQGRLFYTQGPFFCALGPLFCALVREEAIFTVCKPCANEGFACVKKNVVRHYEVSVFRRFDVVFFFFFRRDNDSVK